MTETEQALAEFKKAEPDQWNQAIKNVEFLQSIEAEQPGILASYGITPIADRVDLYAPRNALDLSNTKNFPYKDYPTAEDQEYSTILKFGQELPGYTGEILGATGGGALLGGAGNYLLREKPLIEPGAEIPEDKRTWRNLKRTNEQGTKVKAYDASKQFENALKKPVNDANALVAEKQTNIADSQADYNKRLKSYNDAIHGEVKMVARDGDPNARMGQIPTDDSGALKKQSFWSQQHAYWHTARDQFMQDNGGRDHIMSLDPSDPDYKTRQIIESYNTRVNEAADALDRVNYDINEGIAKKFGIQIKVDEKADGGNPGKRVTYDLERGDGTSSYEPHQALIDEQKSAMQGNKPTALNRAKMDAAEVFFKKYGVKVPDIGDLGKEIKRSDGTTEKAFSPSDRAEIEKRYKDALDRHMEPKIKKLGRIFPSIKKAWESSYADAEGQGAGKALRGTKNLAGKTWDKTGGSGLLRGGLVAGGATWLGSDLAKGFYDASKGMKQEEFDEAKEYFDIMENFSVYDDDYEHMFLDTNEPKAKAALDAWNAGKADPEKGHYYYQAVDGQSPNALKPK